MAISRGPCQGTGQGEVMEGVTMVAPAAVPVAAVVH